MTPHQIAQEAGCLAALSDGGEALNRRAFLVSSLILGVNAANQH